MKILVISNLYPNLLQPQHGIFIEHRVRSLLQYSDAEVKVLAPVPWFPLKRPVFGKYSVFARVPRTDSRYGVRIVYPRYPVIPKIGTNLAPLGLASALIKPLRRILRGGYDFDLIDAYYSYPDGVAATMLGRYFGRPVIITALGSDINFFTSYRIPRWMIKWAARNADAITTVSNALKDRLVGLGIDSDTIRVNLHGVDQRLFKPPADRAMLRKQLNIVRPTLISVGNLIELKGHHVGIQALTALPDVDLIIAGEGKEERTLKKLASSLGLAERVRFLGHVSQEDLRDYYGAADVLILASSREGIANVLLESMACGTPVIATRVGGLPEIITTPEAGVLMRNRTPEALVQAVRALFAHYPDRSATRRFVEQFSWKRTSEQHLALLDEILATRANPAKP
jgi:glycosyltransferase involved in cell wall biosynthesis